MSLNEIKFFSYLNKFKCFEKNPHVAVGVSGGPDSIALVYLINKWIKSKNGNLSALIFDHRIRSNSEQESYQVRDNLIDLNINAKILKTRKNKPIKKNMAQARSNRFDGLITFCQKNNIHHLFLGHHFDDNLETYLIRKINGSNFEGLGSIEEITYFKKIQILRPFIQINKNSILDFNKKNNLFFINDPSNKDENYTRVKVRNFLQNNKYKKLIKYDFINLKKEIPYYKHMVWKYLIDTVDEVKPKSIKIKRNTLLKFDDLIIEKIILLCLKFFSDQKYKARSSKINLFISEMKKSRFKIFNLTGVSIKKNADFLIFFQK
ncbi:tRNA lysidine(34) synthetase TilS [Pelagibacteraceae bacterium]|nr:tRNA lysidine(34) synthetase TilS [Pelagibacteraceae bacterium]